MTESERRLLMRVAQLVYDNCPDWYRSPRSVAEIRMELDGLMEAVAEESET